MWRWKASISSGFGAGAITDLSGNPFAGILNDTDWNFTTGIATLFITPISAVASSEWSDAFVNPTNLVNSSGLTENSENGTHDSNADKTAGFLIVAKCSQAGLQGGRYL